ncbi:unnamed protein product [Durusdinium trenchii]|uniref:Uncharacterized protein n=1 Tax=Durusdinium trenchii TaxID=1381693 RepID=A0ABP0J4H1_9DINO
MWMGPYGPGPRRPGPLNPRASPVRAPEPMALGSIGVREAMTMVAPLPVGRVDLKKAEEAQKAAQEAAAARAPKPADPKKELAEKLRKVQDEENGRVLWWSFCKVHANGQLDPNQHDAAFLLTFFECFEKGDILEEPGCPNSVRFGQQAVRKGVSKGKGRPPMNVAAAKGGKGPITGWGGMWGMGKGGPMEYGMVVSLAASYLLHIRQKRAARADHTKNRG